MFLSSPQCSRFLQTYVKELAIYGILKRPGLCEVVLVGVICRRRWFHLARGGLEAAIHTHTRELLRTFLRARS